MGYRNMQLHAPAAPKRAKPEIIQGAPSLIGSLAGWG